LPHFPTPFQPPQDMHSYSPTHPKMRTGDPPVPPGLVKRRQRWSLGLPVTRRTESYESQNSEESVRSSGTGLSTDQYLDSDHEWDRGINRQNISRDGCEYALIQGDRNALPPNSGSEE
jgi:hypothetical protein